MESRKETTAINRSTVVDALFLCPVITVAQLEVTTRLTNNALHRILTRLRNGREAVTRGGDGHGPARWWLSAYGAEVHSRRSGLPIPWQATEEGVWHLMHRLPVVDAVHHLASRFWSHPGVHIDDGAFSMSSPGMVLAKYWNDPYIADVQWFKDGAVDAMVDFGNGAWIALVWVGTQETHHDLQGRAERARRTPGVTLDPKTGKVLRPAGWVIVGADPLAAADAADAWADSNVLAVSIDGHVEQEMRVDRFHVRPELSQGPFELGQPEQVVRRAQRDPVLQALSNGASYEMLRFIDAWRGVTPAQLKRRFGTSYGAALGPLVRHRLGTKRDGGLYVDDRGGKALADIDGVDVKKVQKRLRTLLKGDGKYRLNQQKHDRGLVDVAIKFHEEGIPVFAGRRHFVDLQTITQIDPDAALCLTRDDGRSLVVLLELEFTAVTPELIDAKLSTYLKALEAGEIIVSVWLFEEHHVARRYLEKGSDLVMLAAQLEEFLGGTSIGANSVWSNPSRRCAITELPVMVELTKK